MDNRTIKLAMAAALLAGRLTAADIYVSSQGTPNGDGTSANPYATISAAVSAASQGDTIYVAGGTYTEAVTSDKSAITVSGSWSEDFASRDLRHNRTVIKAPSSSQNCFEITGSATTSNRLVGITLTGGQYGFRPQGSNEREATTFNTIQQCIITNCATAIHPNRNQDGLRVISSLIADNDEGLNFNSDTGGDLWFVNCTFWGNTSFAMKKQHAYSSKLHVVNSIIANNGYGYHMSGGEDNYQTEFRHVLWSGNTADFLFQPADNNSNIGSKRTVFDEVQFHAVPKLDAYFAPLAGSACIGSGLDFSSDATIPFDEDLYGDKWTGRWGIGCARGTASAPAKYSVQYVAANGGDDSNDGVTPSSPKATINAALAALAEGGTVNVANGTYTESVMAGVAGATIAGESRAGVIIQPTAPSSGSSSYTTTRIDFAFLICAPDVTIRNMTLRNGNAGAYIMPASATRNSLIENCLISGNNVGVLFPTQSDQGTYYTRLSHCIISGNWRGVHYQSALRADNCLVADNADAGIYVKAEGGGRAYFANLTIAGNGTFGYYSGDGNGTIFDNCIIADNGNYGAYDKQNFNRYKFYSCCFWGNVPDATNANIKTVENCIFENPLLDTSSSLRGHLGSHSPCSQSGAAYSDRPFTVTDDLDYTARIDGKMDIGCYVSPETFAETAGAGSHVLTVTGTPDAYGSPTPPYGTSTVQDGTLSFNLSAMLTTSAFDGARCVDVDEGIRAVYQGYAYTEEYASEPLYVADASTETLTIQDWQTNSTFTIKWALQDRVIASSGSDDCLVSVNGCTAAPCVTNWVERGSTYTLEFTPSYNYSFGEWSGDFPDGAEHRTASTTATSDRPRSISVSLVPLIYVSASSGSDSSGDGTRANPYATISFAVSKAAEGSRIYVQSGLYEESVVNDTIDGLSIFGGFNSSWDRDLRGSPSILKSPSEDANCITLGAVMFNTINGMVLTGGAYGIYMTGPTSVPTDDRNANVNNFEQLVITNNTTGIMKNGAYCGFRIVSCLIADNSSDGIRWNSDNKARGFIHNCTVVRNGRTGIALNYGYSMFDVRNTVSAFNGRYGFDMGRDNDSASSSHNNNYLGGICAYGNGSADIRRVSDLFMVWDNGIRRTARLCMRQRLYFQDPMLDGGCTPLAGSPCIGTGDNLTAYPLHHELEDLYGEPWNGTYNIGCVKGAATAASRTAKDVYVSPSGDDANFGLSEAAPMASIQKALAKLADGGTCHLAAGDYTKAVGIYIPNATLQGAGIGRTIIHGASNPDGTPAIFNIFAAADGVTVRGITSTGGNAGFTLGFSQFAKGLTVDSCEAILNTNGLYAAGMTIARDGNMPAELAFMPDCTETAAPENRITLSRFADNAEFGMFTAAAGSDEGGAFNANIDNCLFARNGKGGVCLQDGKRMTTRLYYCTIAENGGAGVSNGTQNDNSDFLAVNCVIVGNAYGLRMSQYSGGSAEHCLVSENTILDFDNSSNWTGHTNDCSSAEAALDARADARHRYHLTDSSPAVGLARAFTASDPIDEPSTDLDGRTRKPLTHRDAGCFALLPPDGTIVIFK